MIDSDTVAIGHVSGIHQIDSVLHEMITFSILGHRLCESSAAVDESEVIIETCMLSF